MYIQSAAKDGSKIANTLEKKKINFQVGYDNTSKRGKVQITH